jgi:TetR/AcrR family transcriptional regulator, regulator of cefoperazone and chloramphenicol sensitivity
VPKVATAPVETDTRGRLIEAAGRLFANQGYKRVTIREICRMAGANVAAVNYHFGGKLGIYRQVLEEALSRQRRVTEASIRAGAGKPAEARLHEFVRVFVTTASQGGPGWIRGLIFREMWDPTPALTEIAERGLRPRLEYLAGIIAEIMALPPSDRRVLLCAGSLQSQLVMAAWNPIAERLYPGPPPTPGDLDAMVDHIARFSLAGIREVAGSRGSTGSRGTRNGSAG